MRLPFNSQLFQAGDRLLLGVSGGVDSLALLHALSQERAESGWELVAVHVHHGMRGTEADEDAEFLALRCREWQVPLAVERIDVPGLAAERRISLEEAGREARYGAFARLSRELSCNKVVTAHHADDQAETVLLHLFRGAGIDGLAGMPLRRPLSHESASPELVRPLLTVRRSVLEAYCRAHGLEPRLDVTNLDLHYRRNRIRYELMPHLAGYDPAIVEHLLRLSQQARDEMDLLSTEAERLVQDATVVRGVPDYGIPLPAPPPTLALDRSVLCNAPRALLRRGLRRALRTCAGYEAEVSSALVERLINLVESGAGAVDLPGCPLRVSVAERRLLLERLPDHEVLPQPVALSLDGTTTAPGFQLALTSRVGPVPAEVRVPRERAVLDADVIQPPLVLRAPLPGDRFRPLNAPGTRLLSDLFGDHKIPRYYRSRWPILVDREGILWVLGLAVAHRARIQPETERALYLSAVKLGAQPGKGE